MDVAVEPGYSAVVSPIYQRMGTNSAGRRDDAYSDDTHRAGTRTR